jgi:hypothetical protein
VEQPSSATFFCMISWHQSKCERIIKMELLFFDKVKIKGKIQSKNL